MSGFHCIWWMTWYLIIFAHQAKPLKIIRTWSDFQQLGVMCKHHRWEAKLVEFRSLKTGWGETSKEKWYVRLSPVPPLYHFAEFCNFTSDIGKKILQRKAYCHLGNSLCDLQQIGIGQVLHCSNLLAMCAELWSQGWQCDSRAGLTTMSLLFMHSLSLILKNLNKPDLLYNASFTYNQSTLLTCNFRVIKQVDLVSI